MIAKVLRLGLEGLVLKATDVSPKKKIIVNCICLTQ